jgi:transcriptional regulator with PAS, ATPase and Fis domain
MEVRMTSSVIGARASASFRSRAVRQVIEDVTEQALARQTANQQRYELFLYRCSTDFRRIHIGDRILGSSPAIQRVRAVIEKLSRVSSATVLLTGETGCGKNLAARVIHESSMPAEAPFVEINCAALPEHLIESELFGYDKGAFTHAVSTKPGLLEAADGGTLFLDEIAEHLLKRYNLEFKKRVKGFSTEARRGLLGHRWPGNVRELGNCIERAMIFAEKDQIEG